MEGFDLSTISAVYVGNTPYSAIYYGSTKIWPTIVDYLTIPLTFEILGSSYTGTMKWMTSYQSLTRTIQYKKNNGSWTSITSSTSGASISISTGDRIQFRGDNSEYCNGSIYCYFSIDAPCNVSGNIMSLIDSSGFASLTSLSSSYNFAQLFYQCPIVSAENLKLPATTLAANCYRSLFLDCTNLIAAPELPATTMAESCYEGMFWGCTSLTIAPSLPSMSLARLCYSKMFRECTSLTTPPSLPAKQLEELCYYAMFYMSGVTTTPSFSHVNRAYGGCCAYMFQKCTSLTTINDLPLSTSNPATLDGNTIGCYEYMFQGCTSLTTAPSYVPSAYGYSHRYMFSGCTSLATAPPLPSTKLYERCYEGMFNGCTSLTVAPSLASVTTLAGGCCYYMFAGCSSLTTAPIMPTAEVPDAVIINNGAYPTYGNMFRDCTSLTIAPALPATTVGTYAYGYMFYGCTNLTTVPDLPATTLTQNCYQYMFYNCTSLVKAPEIKATVLASYCCRYMFSGCTNLKKAPVLLANTLKTYCYYYMFYNCSSLNYVKCLATSKSASNCTTNWLSGVAASGSFIRPIGVTWSTGTNAVPSGWTSYGALTYIENVNSAYINTGINAANNIGIHIEYEDNYSYGSVSNYVVGARQSSGSTILYAITGSSTGNTTNISYGGSSVNLGITRTKGKKYVVDLQADSTGLDYSMTVDNNTPITGRITNTLSASSVPICLFGFNSSNIKKNTRMYVCQITQNETIVRDFEPVQNSSNVAGMLDTANNVFYGSSNSNTFTASS